MSGIEVHLVTERLYASLINFAITAQPQQRIQEGTPGRHVWHRNRREYSYVPACLFVCSTVACFLRLVSVGHSTISRFPPSLPMEEYFRLTTHRKQLTTAGDTVMSSFVFLPEAEGAQIVKYGNCMQDCCGSQVQGWSRRGQWATCSYINSEALNIHTYAEQEQSELWQCDLAGSRENFLKC